MTDRTGRATPQLSRRAFVKGATLLSVGGGAASLLACTPAEDGSDGPAEEFVWDQETDVLVIGAGYAGVAAAIDAFNGGAEVIIIDKNNVAGGNSIMCAGALQAGGGTHVQVKAGIVDTKERFFNDMFVYGHNRAERVLMQQYVDNNAAEVVQWLEDLGLLWRESVTFQEGHTIASTHQPAESPNGSYPGTNGIAYWAVMNNEVTRLGIPTLLNHTAMKLIQRAEDGAVIGVEVLNEGKTLYFKARKGVVLCPGGYKSNTAMLRNWEPRFDTDISAGGMPYVVNLGEINEAAVDCGAAQRDMSFVCEYRFKWGTEIYQYWNPVSIDNPVSTSTGFNLRNYTNVMMVKNDGKRFVDEALAGEYPQWPFYDAFLTLTERPRTVWAIGDSNVAAANEWNLEQLQNPDKEKTPCLSPEYVAIADTIDELAAKMGINAAALKAEVERYNGFVDAGEDADFGKEGLAIKIEQGPFYALRVTFFAHDQQSGLTVNTKAQVVSRASYFGPSVDIDDRPIIPRLYAGGEVAGGYYGQERGHGKIGVVMYWGRVAGREAAKEASIE